MGLNDVGVSIRCWRCIELFVQCSAPSNCVHVCQANQVLATFLRELIIILSCYIYYYLLLLLLLFIIIYYYYYYYHPYYHICL